VQGFLATAGFLVGVTLAALAAGIWVGVPEPGGAPGGGVPTRARWTWTVIAFAAAWLFALVWEWVLPLRDEPFGGALAVLLMLAEPAYAAAALLIALQSRDAAEPRRADNRIAVLMILGAAVGIVLATALLIPRIAAPGIYLGAATLLGVFGAIESTRPLNPPRSERSSMNGKVVLITGVGDRGQVGYALAARCLAAGARVVVTNRSGELQAIADALAASGGDVVAVNADLTAPADVERLLATTRDRFGRLDALVHAAGGLGVIKAIADTTLGEFRSELERNATTTYLLLHAALPLLRESRGAIVTFASPAGERAVAQLGAYSAAKAGVIALTRAIALEERDNGVRANAIAPGLIDTDQNRASAGADTKFVTREQIEDVVLFLASEASSGITGQTIPVLGATLS
jgi:NAD(P)-dependent dehydrogenase (short-subunit alcohol dehydrogenase family)